MFGEKEKRGERAGEDASEWCKQAYGLDEFFNLRSILESFVWPEEPFGHVFNLRKILVVCSTWERLWSCVQPEKDFGLVCSNGSNQSSQIKTLFHFEFQKIASTNANISEGKAKTK